MKGTPSAASPGELWERIKTLVVFQKLFCP